MRPIRPSGVQLTRPIAPPGRHTRTSSSATTWWRGANWTPNDGEHAVEARVGERQRLGVALDPGDAAVARARAGDVEQVGHEVEAGDVGAELGGAQRDVAGAGGDVEHGVAGLDAGEREQVAGRGASATCSATSA